MGALASENSKYQSLTLDSLQVTKNLYLRLLNLSGRLFFLSIQSPISVIGRLFLLTG
jgi:hypothetical protein